MDSKLFLITKKVGVVGVLLFALCAIFVNMPTAKSVITGYLIFSVNIITLSALLKNLLIKSTTSGDQKLSKGSIIGLALKIPVLFGVLYYVLVVVGMDVVKVFAGSILAMFLAGWLFFEDYLKSIGK